MRAAAPNAVDLTAVGEPGGTDPRRGAGPGRGLDFSSLMEPLGPFGPSPSLVVAVSGGPHSLALALLAHGWACRRGGKVLAVTVDHGLRPEAGSEAAWVAATLGARGIPCRILSLGLLPGPGAQDRARQARLAALLSACRDAGAPWLLLGHHRADQAETLLMRALSGSGPAGLAGMAPTRPMGEAMLLRPLLGVPPAALEAVLAGAGLTPLRDPSNADPRFTRARVRAALADPDGLGGAVAALTEAAGRFAARRAGQEAAVAARLASAALLRPEGFARLDMAALGMDAVAVAALAALIRTVSGRAFAPPETAVAGLLARGAGTLGGARLLHGGLLVREEAAIGPRVPARPGAVWDGRFRLLGSGEEGLEIGAVGASAGLPRPAPLPAAVLRAMPAVWRKDALVAVPGLSYPGLQACAPFRMLFSPLGGAAL